MSIINIGLSGLKVHQTALAVTGNNVTNANTEGYTRQRVEMEATPSMYIGAGYLGSGVEVSDIKRLTNEYLTTQLRSDQAAYSDIEKLRINLEQLDGLLADPTTGLAPAMSAFFSALQSAADDPSSIPERQLLLTQAEGLVNRFNVLHSRLDAQRRAVDEDIRAQVTEVNALARGLSSVNTAIAAATKGDGKKANDLFDQRDLLLRKLSEIVNVNAMINGDGTANVLIGSGQALVVGNRVSEFSVAASEADPTRLDVLLSQNSVEVPVTSELTGGELGGLLRFRDQHLDTAFNTLGRIALVLSDTINAQHQLGMDLEGNFGADFFTDINSLDRQRSRILGGEANAAPNDRVIRAEIVDTAALSTRDYQLQFTGPTDEDILLTDVRTGETITRGRLTGFYPSTFEFDGIRLHFESGSFQTGDRFLVAPTRLGALEIDMNLTRVEGVALASPIRTDTDLGNIGNAMISPGELLDVKSPLTDAILPSFSVPGALTPPVLVRFLNDEYYEVLDNTDPANPVALVPPLNNQKYIPGVRNEIFTRDPAATALSAIGSSVAQIPAASATPTANGYVAQNLTIQVRDPVTGLVSNQPTLSIAADASAGDIAAALNGRNGITAVAYTEVSLDNFVDDGTGTTPTLQINGELVTLPLNGTFSANDLADAINANTALQDLDIVARSDGTTLTIRSLTGQDLRIETIGDVTDSVDISTANAAAVTLAGGTGTQVGGFIDVRMAEGVRLFADSDVIFQQAPVAVSAYTGYTADLSGSPRRGDRFTIDYNRNGVSDNRNALALAGLETTGLIGGNVSTFSESYSQMVEIIGASTSQATIDSDSAKALLTQSENRWQEIAGVNLDEEAGRLIQYQAGYNAAAQVVSIARELFDTLINTIR